MGRWGGRALVEYHWRKAFEGQRTDFGAQLGDCIVCLGQPIKNILELVFHFEALLDNIPCRRGGSLRDYS